MSTANINESPLNVLRYEDASPEAQAIFDNLKKQIKVVPNLYAVIGNSPVALGASIGFGQALGKGTFSPKEVEAIALAVSQTNECDYCIAAHTAVAKMHGVDDAETVNFRRGQSNDQKLAALTALAADIAENRGHATQTRIDAFFEAGYDRAALVELVGYVALNTFNNYVNHIANTPVDWPAVTELR